MITLHLPCKGTEAVCFYHAGCTDGFSAAWAFRTCFQSGDRLYARDIEFIPWVYGREYDAISHPEKMSQPYYFFLDCAPSLEVYKALCAAGKKVYIVDHHATAERAFRGLNVPGIIDTSRSGAVLAWRFLTDDAVPKMLQYVQDRDLWHYDLEASKYVNAYINAQVFSFTTWDDLNARIQSDTGFEKIVDHGVTIVDYQAKEIDRMISKAHARFLAPEGAGAGESVRVLAVNSSALTSEICNEILDRNPNEGIAACYWYDGKSEIWSLRSRRGGPDVSALAEKFGGGGHPTASGFRRDTPL